MAARKLPPTKKTRHKEESEAGDILWHISLVAKACNITAARVQALAKEELIPKSEAGYYPVFETVKRYNAYLRTLIQRGRPTQEKGESANAVLAERHRKLKMENDLKQHELVQMDHVKTVLGELSTTLANVLDGAAGRMAGGDAVLRDKLLHEHRRIRDLYADRIADFVRAHGGVGDPSPTTEPDSSDVGRGKKSPAKRKRRARTV